LLVRRLREPSRALEVRLRLLARGERGRTLTRLDEGVARRGPDLIGVARIGGRHVCRQVVRGHDLDHLVLLATRTEVLGDREVAGLTLLLRKGSVGDLSDEILEEAVLAALG